MDQNHGQRPRYTSERRTQVSKRDYYDDEQDDIYTTRTPSSARRYQSDVRMEVGRTQGDEMPMPQHGYDASYTGRRSSIPARRTANQAMVPAAQSSVTRSPNTTSRRRVIDTKDDVMARRSGGLEDHPRRRIHWLVFVGIGLLVMMGGWILLSSVLSWWQVTQDDMHYGRPRTFQTDFVVGHNDSTANPSHFLAINLNRHVEIIEISGGDPAKTKIYNGPTLLDPRQDLTVVTLSFKDVNGDGKPDMIVNVQDSHFVFINDTVNGVQQFRPVRTGENIQAQ